jgi:DNA-binding NarL/FixJ family response regulator
MEVLMNNKKPRLSASLTKREHAVARLVAEGHSNKTIAQCLSISQHTTKFHVCNFITKMNAQTRVDAAVKYALDVAALTFPLTCPLRDTETVT